MTNSTDLLSRMDEFGPEKILTVSDPKTGMKGVLVIDNTARGPGKGGCRMTPNLQIDEVCRLARAMTWKWAMVDFKFGGAKAGICNDPKSPNKEEIVRSFVRALEKHIPSEYVFGLDMGLKESDAAIVVDEFDNLGASMGTPTELGGLPYDELGAAGYGAAESARIAAKLKNKDLNNISVAIQGFGALSMGAAKFLSNIGVNVVAVSKSEGALYDPNGLDIQKLAEMKERGENVIEDYGRGKVLKLGEELLLDVDVLIPGATQDVITKDNVEDVKADIIVEGANMPTTTEAENILSSKGKLIIPDFVASAGGILAAAIGMDAIYSSRRPEPKQVYDLITSKMEEIVPTVMEEASSRNVKTRDAAMKIAQERVIKAMQYRGNKRIKLQD